MSTLSQAISELASEFATQLLNMVRGASFDDVAVVLTDADSGRVRAQAGRTAQRSGGARVVQGRVRAVAASGGRVRRTPEDLETLTSKVVAFVRKHKDGVSVGAIGEAVGIERKDLLRPILDALKARLISKTGQKRGTLYVAGSKTVKAKAKAKSSGRKAKAVKTKAKAAGRKTKVKAKPVRKAKAKVKAKKLKRAPVKKTKSVKAAKSATNGVSASASASASPSAAAAVAAS